MNGKRKKIVMIAGGILLLVITAVVTFFVLKGVGDTEELSDTLGENRRGPASVESGEERGESLPEETFESKDTEKDGREPLPEEARESREQEKEGRESLPEEARESEEKDGREQRETEAGDLVTGPLQVIGTSLCDSRGNPVQLRGVSTHGLAWFPDYVNEELFRELHEQWNVNVIRLAMYTAEYGGYCSGGDKEQLKQLIRNGVEYASARNMYVIVDWHILSDGDPNTYKEEAKNFFREMSAEFADRENILYEICNEPNGGTGWSRVKEYAEEMIPVIRENDEDAVILVGTPNWCQYVDQAAADPITEWDNIMYTLHFYAATHKDDLRQTMTAALDAGLPIFVSEYGICDASGNGGIDEAQAAAWVETMDRYGVSYVAWNLSNKNETSALIKSSCNKTSGLSGDDLSAAGKWLYDVLTGGRATPEGSMPGGSEGSQSGAAAASAEDLKITVQVVNSWESEGRFYYQYEMTVENISDRTIDGWQADIVFNDAPELSDSWNGVFAPEGNILHISSVDYNKQLESGSSVDNIGFIVSGSADFVP